ncbi:MOSC domain-containing protein [uncultured Roseibium sp.]|uniref:MOSC domain-containing protein n=1 Tax=uncultured Roseibium sp. TaxID=1936171 RepID=UPI0032179504
MSASIVAIYSGAARPEIFGTTPGRTGFRRAAWEGPAQVTETGIVGDELADPRRLGRANHAVYLFNQVHYAFFEQVLNKSLPGACFAENLTYEGPDETEFRIGDRLAVGDVILRITTPRVPCYKLRHFLDAPQGFPAAFSATGKTGFYASVEQTGEVRTGDALCLIGTDPRNATVAELNEALTGFTLDPALVGRVLASPDLLPGAADQIRERMARFRPELSVQPLSGRIVGHALLAPDTAAIDIEVLNGQTPEWAPGQFITLGHSAGAGALYRCYSLISGPTASDPATPFSIAVRASEGTTRETSLSRRLVDGEVLGEGVTVYPPSGEFLLSDDCTVPRVYIAGGIGITPILAHLRALFRTTVSPKVHLVYVARTGEVAVFAEELAQMAAASEEFSFELWLTAEVGTASRHGRPDFADLVRNLPDPAEVYVCGPVAMIEELRRAYGATGRPNARLHFEMFEPPATDGEAAVDSAKIRIAGTGVEGLWTTEDGTLLNWVETRTGFRPPAACRSGLCRTCEATLDQGVVVYPSGIAAPAPGRVLLCCGRPGSGTLEVGLPAGTACSRTLEEQETPA